MMYMPKRRKIVVLVTWPVFASAVQISHKSTKIALKYRRKNFQYGLRPPSWICNISNFCQMSVLGMEIRIFISIDRNQLINGWDMEIKLFSKWRLSRYYVAVLSLVCLLFSYVVRVDALGQITLSEALYVHILISCSIWSIQLGSVASRSPSVITVTF